MKMKLDIERISTDMDCYEDTLKFIKYKITNKNRFPVTDIQVNAKTIKEDGNDTSKNYCKKVDGVKHRLMPKDDCEITVTVKLPSDYNETVIIDGVKEISACDLDINVTGKLVIGKIG